MPSSDPSESGTAVTRKHGDAGPAPSVHGFDGVGHNDASTAQSTASTPEAHGPSDGGDSQSDSDRQPSGPGAAKVNRQAVQPNRQAGEVKDGMDLETVHGGYLAELTITDVGPNLHQPRSIFDEDELNELADSIRQVGVLQPIVVRKRPAHQVDGNASGHQPDTAAHRTQAAVEGVRPATGPDTSADVASGVTAGSAVSGGIGSDTPYELIMGERRWRASQLAGLTTIPAIVKTTQDDAMLRDALLENLHRVNLNPLEEAAAYHQMIEEFGLTQGQLSTAVSKSRPQIANTLRLLNLPGSVQKRVAAGVLSAGHARALLGLTDAEDMDALAKRIIAEGLSVRSTEEIVAMKTSGPSATSTSTVRRTSPWQDSPIRHSLEDHFETKVAIRGNGKHGKIEIVFSSPDDMQRIVDLLMPKNAGDAAVKTTKSADEDGWV